MESLDLRVLAEAMAWRRSGHDVTIDDYFDRLLG